MAKLTINGRAVEVPNGMTVLQACQSLGIEIPHFCYHERLSIAGNCRMCLVEIEKMPKPAASCAQPVMDGMVVHTDNEKVRKARQGVMEFLLINHPLDCPICDQGGECDLQDQAMGYGYDRSRYHENKRAVDDKYMGPLVQTIMTRCIHCTRCIRFATEVAGVEEIGALGRGEHMEITSYLERSLTSELSGNVIDLCPVGALTSKPYAFTARSWEIRKTESIDVMDALGCNIRVDARGNEVMRILPRLNEEINEEWISDKTRFVYDGLKRQRLDTPYVRRDGKLQPATWNEAFAVIAGRVKSLSGDEIAAVAGDLADCESMTLLKELMASLGSRHIDCRQDGAKLDAHERSSWLFNSTIAGIDQADALALIGTNPRLEAPVLNARIRKRWQQGKFPIAVIGPRADLTYRYDYLGAGPSTLADLAAGKHAFSEVLKKAQRPMLILGQGALARKDGAAILGLARRLAEGAGMVKAGWNGFNVLHTAAARVGGLEVGFVPDQSGRDLEGILAGAGTGAIKLVYLLGADEIDMKRLGRAFVIYQGHHGDAGANRADVILPGAAYTEKAATYVNTEGRAQHTKLAVFPPGDAREDWTILRALSEALGHRLPYDTPAAVRAGLMARSRVFGAIDRVVPASWGEFGAEGAVDATPFTSPVANFYMTDPISRCSRIMAACTAQKRDLDAAAAGAQTGTGG
jgi:NADH-quinone oxidoreductase subunit G